MRPRSTGADRISVIIPTFNRAALLPRAIESALRQTAGAACDIVVIDDGSSDETPHVAGRYRDRIRYIRQPHTGVSAARNTGIRASPGEFVAFLDSDDEWLPAKIERQMHALAEHPDVVCCGTGLADAGGRGCRGSPAADAHTRDAPAGYCDFAPGLFNANFLVTSGVVVRRRALDRVGLFRRGLRACEDYDLWLRLACHGPGLLLSDRLTVYRRGTPGSLAGNVRRLLLEELRVRYLARALLHQRPDCRAAWDRGMARTCATLRDLALRERRYAAVVRFGLLSLTAQPRARPRWEWLRCLAALGATVGCPGATRLSGHDSARMD